MISEEDLDKALSIAFKIGWNRGPKTKDEDKWSEILPISEEELKFHDEFEIRLLKEINKK